MNQSPPARDCKPASVLLAAPLGLMLLIALSGCTSEKIDPADLEEKLNRAEAAAQRAVAAQQAAETAAARVSHIEESRIENEESDRRREEEALAETNAAAEATAQPAPGA